MFEIVILIATKMADKQIPLDREMLQKIIAGIDKIMEVMEENIGAINLKYVRNIYIQMKMLSVTLFFDYHIFL